ncbi:hypothetical protein E2C01_100193 [Portunus trituberculatus]|uniref:Uncharacterized protein n=1 Tax=Portunus trituberculatus TaxID=210409 RepID=A0A5B7KBE1_PORTR|nr:hypothetical protein [Portunus trituberculatus]
MSAVWPSVEATLKEGKARDAEQGLVVPAPSTWPSYRQDAHWPSKAPPHNKASGHSLKPEESQNLRIAPNKARFT